MKKSLLALTVTVAILTGCAQVHSVTHKSTRSYVAGTNLVTDTTESTHATAFSFFDSTDNLTKFRNGSSPSTVSTNVYSPGTYIGSVDQSSSSSNLWNGAAQITAAGVAAFVQSAK
jgi:hypothetical protein